MLNGFSAGGVLPGGGGTLNELILNTAGITEWPISEGVTEAAALLVGGGGQGGSSHENYQSGGGGGGGEIVWCPFIPLVGLSNVTLTVGAGGTGGAYKWDVKNGGATSVGSIVSALGGIGGRSDRTAGQQAGGNGGGAFSRKVLAASLYKSTVQYEPTGWGGYIYNSADPTLYSAGWDSEVVHVGINTLRMAGAGGGAPGYSTKKYGYYGGRCYGFSYTTAGRGSSTGLGAGGGGGGASYGPGGVGGSTNYGAADPRIHGTAGVQGGGGGGCGSYNINSAYLGGDGGDGLIKLYWRA